MTKRVLIVEDEIFVALEIEHIVRSAGLQVSAIAADRASALAAAKNSDIALVDLNLRDGATGPSIGEALAFEHDVRVIYVTANPAQIGSADVAALGVISKPFQETTIRQAVILAASETIEVNDMPIAGFTRFPSASGSSISAGW